MSHISDEGQRELSDVECRLVDQRIEVWNVATGDNASLLDGATARSTCDCGCPSFEARPFAIDFNGTSDSDLTVNGVASSADNTSLACLTVFQAGLGGLHFDIS